MKTAIKINIGEKYLYVVDKDNKHITYFEIFEDKKI